MIKVEKLKGFEQHGVIFTDQQNDEALGACVFCHGGKMSVNIESRLWRCFTCGTTGNFNKFLALRAAEYRKSLIGKPIKDLAELRGIKPTTFRQWGVGWSGTFYSIPEAGNPRGAVTNIRKYAPGSKTMATAGSHASMIAPLEQLGDSQVVWVCEGEWDGMAWWEVLSALGMHNLIYSVPGASTFPRQSLELLAGKDVVLLFDADEAGRLGMIAAGRKLDGIATSVRYLKWPAGTPNGFDLRDLYLQQERNAKRVFDTVAGLLTATLEEPLEVKADAVSVHTSDSDGGLNGEGLHPSQVETIFQHWLSMKTTDPLDIMFGSLFANRLPGDPLWLLLVAPPGGMKTELLMSLSRAPLLTSTTTLTPHSLISGANFAGGDPSLIPRLNKKVLVIKDLTTILEMNQTQRDEIFGILRDAYDGKIEKVFGNGVVRRYNSKFGLLAGVTPVIESVNRTNATLGERFLKYKIKQHDNKQATENAIRQALANIKNNDRMRTELADCGRAVLAWQPPDGYIPELSEEMTERFVGLARWVAMLRGVVDRERYTGRVQYKPMTEVGTRLAKQLCKLAYGIAIYRREAEITESVYRLIVEVAQDTAPDRVEEIVHQMYSHDPDDFKSTKDVAHWCKFPDDTIRYILQDLVLLKIVEKAPQGGSLWRLAPAVVANMRSLRMYRSRGAVKRRD